MKRFPRREADTNSTTAIARKYWTRYSQRLAVPTAPLLHLALMR
jgi:hypothetical protein